METVVDVGVGVGACALASLANNASENRRMYIMLADSLIEQYFTLTDYTTFRAIEKGTLLHKFNHYMPQIYANHPNASVEKVFHRIVGADLHIRPNATYLHDLYIHPSNLCKP